MSTASKLEKLTAGLSKELDKKAGRSDPPISQAGPLQVMALRTEMNGYEDKIAALEAALADAKRTEIPVDLITPNPWQPRRVFDDAEIQKLAGSIAEAGLIQPIIVRSVWNPDTSSADPKSVWNPDTRYQLVAGERRWRAHQVLGRTDIKAIVISAADDEMAALALAENFDREDLTAYEIALAIRNAETAFPTKKSLAAVLGINRTDLYKYLAFFDLPAFMLVDLEATPGLLGRDSAYDIAAVIKKRGAAAANTVTRIWARYKAGEIDQGKVAAAIEAMATKGTTTRTDRDIKKLFVGKEQAGSITKDASSLTIKIKSAALTGDQEGRLREFVEGLLRG